MTELRLVFRATASHVQRVRVRADAVNADVSLSRWRRRALTEVLISDMWLIWNDFVREILIASCAGCTTRAGIVVSPRAADNSWQRISYESKEIAVSRRVGKIPKIHAKRVNSYRYQDPTWGDLDYIVDVVAGLAPTNSANLISAFGATSRGLKDLQTVRNACFHKHRESWDAVKSTETINFASSDTRDPSDLAWKPYIGKSNASIYDWAGSVIAVCDSVSK